MTLPWLSTRSSLLNLRSAGRNQVGIFKRSACENQSVGIRRFRWTRTLYGKMGLILTTLFGVIIFLSKVFLPPPMNDMFVVVQALLLALSSLIVGRFGAT